MSTSTNIEPETAAAIPTPAAHQFVLPVVRPVASVTAHPLAEAWPGRNG